MDPKKFRANEGSSYQSVIFVMYVLRRLILKSVVSVHPSTNSASSFYKVVLIPVFQISSSSGQSVALSYSVIEVKFSQSMTKDATESCITVLS